MIIKYDNSICPPISKNIYLPPTQDIAWIQIPKCGTSTMRSLWDWETQSATGKYKDMKRLVILREPYERWLSAVVEALNPKPEKNKPDMAKIEERFHTWDLFRGTTDRHLYPQARFCNNLDIDNAIFIWLDELEDKLPLVFPGVEVPHLRKGNAQNKNMVREFVLDKVEKKIVLYKSCVRIDYVEDYILLEYLREKHLFL